MIQKTFDEITKADIENLIGFSEAENKTLEFKEELPGRTESNKKEFLADVSSFANASGGDIIYGIREEDGKVAKIMPIQGKTVDKAKRWIEDVLRYGIEPRLQFQLKEIAGFGDDGTDVVILIRVPQSFASPHMVTYERWSRFFCRNSNSKYQLDVDEIRNAFMATDSQADRIRRFLQDRVAKIMADETPLPMSNPHKLVLHVIPLNNFLNRKRLNFSHENDLARHFPPIGGGLGYRYNLDGFLTHLTMGSNCSSYCQLFFNGSTEVVCSDILAKVKELPNLKLSYEMMTTNVLEMHFAGYRALAVDGPFIISLTLLNCKGTYLEVEDSFSYHVAESIDRDVAIFPEVQVESFDEDIPIIMKPIFDSVWNAYGYPRSGLFYDEDGKWKFAGR